MPILWWGDNVSVWPFHARTHLKAFFCGHRSLAAHWVWSSWSFAAVPMTTRTMPPSPQASRMGSQITPLLQLDTDIEKKGAYAISVAYFLNVWIWLKIVDNFLSSLLISIPMILKSHGILNCAFKSNYLVKECYSSQLQSECLLRHFLMVCLRNWQKYLFTTWKAHQ